MTGAGLTQVLQVAVAVRNLDEAVRRYADYYGFGPWRVLNCTPASIRDMQIHGQSREYSMRIALCTLGGVDWELLEPSDDRSIYAEFLQEHGDGLHHIGFDTPQWEESMRVLDSLGIPVRMSGNWGGRQEYRYLGTEADLGFLAEVFHTAPGFEHPEPDEIYPPHSGAPDRGAAGREPSRWGASAGRPALIPQFSGVRRVAVVVPDLAPFVERYRDRYGFGPWTAWRSPGFPCRLATCRIGEIEWALIQPDPQPPESVYQGFLHEHGGGLHHVVLETIDFPQALEALRARGVALQATGDWMDGRPLVYADTRQELGCAVELAVPASADLAALGLQVLPIRPLAQAI